MPDVLLQSSALFAMVLVAALFALEVRKWESLRSVISRRQRLVRIWLIVIVELLLAMVFLGPWVTSGRDPVAALLYWMVCVVLGIGVVVLTLFDLREVMRGYARVSRRMFRDLTEDDGKKN